MKFRLIPAGEFAMGSANGDPDEAVLRRVVLSQPFYLGTYEVTLKQFQEIIGYNPSVAIIPPDHPVGNAGGLRVVLTIPAKNESAEE